MHADQVLVRTLQLLVDGTSTILQIQMRKYSKAPW